MDISEVFAYLDCSLKEWKDNSLYVDEEVLDEIERIRIRKKVELRNHCISSDSATLVIKGMALFVDDLELKKISGIDIEERPKPGEQLKLQFEVVDPQANGKDD